MLVIKQCCIAAVVADVNSKFPCVHMLDGTNPCFDFDSYPMLTTAIVDIFILACFAFYIVLDGRNGLHEIENIGYIRMLCLPFPRRFI